MDGQKGRRKGSGQLSVPELVVPPPDRSTFETIESPHTIINGKIVCHLSIMIYIFTS